MIVEQCDILQAYSDRFSVIRETFEAINETSVEEKAKLLPDNISKKVEDMHNMPTRSWQHRWNMPASGLSIEYFAGPVDWWNGVGYGHDNPDTVVNDHLTVTKIDVFLENKGAQDMAIENFPELRYWINLLDDYVPILSERYQDVTDQHDNIIDWRPFLTLIENAAPNATPETYDEQMSWHSEKHGCDHADELIGAYHLGETHSGFYTKGGPYGNTKTYYPDLLGGKTNHLWTWGQYAELSGYTPTIHGVDYIQREPTNRYSILINLGVNYKEQ